MMRKLVVVAMVVMTLMLAVSTSSARTSTAIRPTTAVQLVAQTVVEARVEVVSFFVEFEAAVPRLTPAFW
jgi:type II secretory pathway component PulK